MIIFSIIEAILYSIYPLFNFLKFYICPNRAYCYYPNNLHNYLHSCNSLLHILASSQIYTPLCIIFHQAKSITPFHAFDFVSIRQYISLHFNEPLLPFLRVCLRQIILQIRTLFALKSLFRVCDYSRISHYIYFHPCR